MRLLAAFLLAFTVGHAAESPPKAPPFERPPFDTRRIALAIGKLVPGGGSVVVVSSTGIAVTAYHAMAPCVVRLRRDPATRPFFHKDGSYYGEHGPLLCDGVAVELPNCANGADRAEPVYVVGVPPVREAQIIDQSPDLGDLSHEPAVPKSDFAVIKIDHPVTSYLQLTNHKVTRDTRMWVAGYLDTRDRESLTSVDMQHQRHLGHLMLRTREALFEILAHAASDPVKGMESAQAFLKGYESPTGPFGEVVAATMGDELSDIEEVASGADAARAVVRKRLLAVTRTLEDRARASDVVDEEAASLSARARKLRRLAESAYGPAVRVEMLYLKAQAAELATNMEWDLTGDYSVPSEQWCGVSAFAGRISSAAETTIVSNAFVGRGMSGGPALDRDGMVIGLVIQGRRLVDSYYPDNLIVVRSSAIIRHFGKLINGPSPTVMRPAPTIGVE